MAHSLCMPRILTLLRIDRNKIYSCGIIHGRSQSLHSPRTPGRLGLPRTPFKPRYDNFLGLPRKGPRRKGRDSPPWRVKMGPASRSQVTA